MSAFAGRLALDGSPVSPSLRQKFTAGLQVHAADASDAKELPGCLVAFGAAYCVPGEDTSPQPAQSGAVITTFDGRLDNRQELASRSGLGIVTAETPDIVLVQAACRTAGPTCVRDFIGDFALAIVDQERRLVWLARDAFGTRPPVLFHKGALYYLVDGT